MFVILIQVLVLAACNIEEPKKSSEDKTMQSGHINGEIVCLPTKRGTEECAYGIRAEDNKYYGLLNINHDDIINGKISIGDKVSISGIMKPASRQFLNSYQVDGQIEIKSFKSSLTGQSSNATAGMGFPSLSGGLFNYPDYSLDGVPTEPIPVKFLVEHRTALNQKVLSVKGIVVGTLLGEEACPSQGLKLGCSQPRILIADSSDDNRDKNYDIIILVGEERIDYKSGDAVEIKVTVHSTKNAVIMISNR